MSARRRQPPGCDAISQRPVRGPLVAGLLALVLVAGACGGGAAPVPPPDPERYRAEVMTWRQRRHDDLMRPDGWLSLVGLYWLADTPQSLGSGADADLRYDRAGVPDLLGSFEVDANGVTFVSAPGVEITVDGVRVQRRRAYAEGNEDPPPVFDWGTLRWHVIRRGDRLAVRLKDSDSPVRTGFQGLEYFPIQVAWRLPGRFEPYRPPHTIQVPNILGQVNETESAGAVRFDIDGVEYRLDVWKDSDDPENFFTAFGDTTNGASTYGGGRFLWVDAPDASGAVVVDFNRAYNPPCVFTAFATCPLPPRQNRLPTPVEAGEKRFGGH